MSNHERDLAVQWLQLQSELALEYGVSLADRSIQLVGNITEETFCEVDAKLSILEAQSRKAITIKINSEGGHVYDALAIIGRMQRSPCNIITEGYGSVMSAATLILAAGKRRKMHSLAFLMHHEGGFSMEGTHSQVAHFLKQADRENKMWCATLETFTGTPAAFWASQGLSGLDLFLNAEQCLKYKIIDEIF